MGKGEGGKGKREGESEGEWTQKLLFFKLYTNFPKDDYR